MAESCITGNAAGHDAAAALQPARVGGPAPRVVLYTDTGVAEMVAQSGAV